MANLLDAAPLVVRSSAGCAGSAKRLLKNESAATSPASTVPEPLVYGTGSVRGSRGDSLTTEGHHRYGSSGSTLRPPRGPETQRKHLHFTLCTMPWPPSTSFTPTTNHSVLVNRRHLGLLNHGDLLGRDEHARPGDFHCTNSP